MGKDKRPPGSQPRRPAAATPETVSLASSSGRSPFLVIEGPEGGAFVDVCFNFDTTLDVPVEDLLRFLVTSEPGSILIARRLDEEEVQSLLDRRRDADLEAFAFVIPRNDLRWRPGGRGRH